MRRLLTTLALLSVVALAALSADLPEKWRSWQYSRGLTANATNSNVVPAQVTLPWEIFAHCAPGCADLRIIDDAGAEVPFLLTARNSGTLSDQVRTLHILENSFVAAEYTQVIGDLGDNGSPTYNQVTVQTSRSDFLVWAEVALSDNANTWRVVMPRAPIARFRSRSIEGDQTISFRGLGSRYLRLRIFAPAEKFPLEGLTVSRELVSTVWRSEIPASFAVLNPAKPSESVFQAALASPNQPTSEVRLQTDSPEFYRGVRIGGSNDGQDWSYFGSGVAYRYKQGDRLRESLAIEYPENLGYRLLRVEIVNGDDQPLKNVRLTCAAFPRTVALKYAPGGTYRLLYGNDHASQGRYDIGNYFHTEGDSTSLLTLSLQPEQTTANYRDPRPFTERHPEVLWIALAAAIVMIGLTAIRTLRAPSVPATKS